MKKDYKREIFLKVMIDYGAGVSKGYVADVSWGKSITRFFNMQVLLKIIDINQQVAKQGRKDD